MPLFGPNIKKMKKKGNIEGIIKALDYNKEVGEAASNALVQMGEPAVSKIIDALDQSEKSVRTKAIQILGKIGSGQAKEALLMLLDDDDDGVREEIVQSLGTFQDEKLTGHFVQALKDQDWRVRNKAALALDKLSWEPISDQDKVYYGIATEMWKELELWGETSVEPLIEALDLNYVHNDAALTLGKIGSTKAISPLIRMLGREVERNIEFGMFTSNDYNVMIVSAMALNMIGEPAIPHLIQALSSEHLPTRAGAEMALFSLGDRAITPLTKALDDENDIIRETSAELLKKIKKEAD